MEKMVVVGASIVGRGTPSWMCATRLKCYSWSCLVMLLARTSKKETMQKKEQPPIQHCEKFTKAGIKTSSAKIIAK